MTQARPVAPDKQPVDDFAGLRKGLRGWLRRQVGDAATAEDLLQDVFVRLLAARRARSSIGNLNGWIHAVARSVVADHYRNQRLDTEPLAEDVPEHSPSDAEEDTRLHQALATCMRPLANRLPARYRDTLIAADLEGQAMASLAQKEGVSVSAIKSRASRGRAMLRDRLLACCEVETAQGLVVDYQQKGARGCGSGGSCN